MFPLKSLAAIAGTHVCDQDDEFKLCVKILATEKAVTKRVRRNYVPSARGYAVKKRWAVDFKRVHMQGRQPLCFYRWALARACVNGHPNPVELLPSGYLASRRRADDEISRTVASVNKSWARLDRAGIPHREAGIRERRQVHGLDFETIRACMGDRLTHRLDKPEEMRCRHNAGRNGTCWRPPCGPPLPRMSDDKDVPESLNDIFWDSD
ncbi:hypothetical protein AAVH_19817 [Aphelenchoides avenae]|nr:hypothetical protein AAVH_42972 [Aphelenchus avenae]KAH7712828.1 hypothetical protein AAVH_19817 [Aphelenchus avenae]